MTGQVASFEPIAERDIDGVRITEFVERVTGLRHVHVATPTPHLVIALAAHTPTPGRPGLPHMLEHWIGSGSRLFPVRHLFPALLNRTAATFMNAFTGPGHTSFVAATTCPASADLLTDALIDGVFHPLLHEEDFAEEAFGVHSSASGTGLYGGVVWQEAVTRLGDPPSLAVPALAASLYGQSTMSLLQGQGLQPLDLVGVVPDDAREYHRSFYHPGRIWLITAGDLPASRFQRRAMRVLEHSTFRPPGDLRPEVTPQPDKSLVVKVAGAAGPGTGDAMVAIGLEPVDVPGAIARAQILQDALARKREGSLREALKACGVVRYAPGSGVHAIYPHTIFGVGVVTRKPGDAARAHEVLAEALPTAFGSDDIRAAAQRKLLDAYDRSHRPHPAPMWPVQQVLDAVLPLTRGADPLDVFDLESHLRSQLDEPERTLQVLTNGLGSIGRVIVDRTGPTARQSFDTAVAALPLGKPRRVDSRIAATPPLVTIKELSPRSASSEPERLDDELWLWRTDTNGVGYATVDIDLCGLAPRFLPILRLLAAPFNHSARWRVTTDVVVEAHESNVDVPRLWVRASLTSHRDDIHAAHSWLMRRFAAMRDDPAGWAERAMRGLRTAAAAPAGLSLLRSATAARVSLTGVVDDRVNGLAARHRLRSLLEDPSTARSLFTAATKDLARMPRTVVITQEPNVPLPDEIAWGEFSGTVRQAPGDPLAVTLPSNGDPVLLPSSSGPPYVLLTYRSVPAAHPDAAADLLLAAILDRRLYRTLRAASAHGSKAALSWRTGALTLAAAGSDRLGDALAAMGDLLTEMATRPPEEDELAAGRTAAVVSLNRPPSVHDQAADLVRARATGWHSIRKRILDAAKRSHRDAVLESARRYQEGPAAALGAIGPESALSYLSGSLATSTPAAITSGVQA
ncbi:insulinase family protein [Nonomuraea sp. K274]|uniref:Insulinase family protein n=1 Tax=Nonomuraea cypriaca TaxID=1187855 RepID=A0A931A4B4_9ACTN|nr:insulinase family protein [Nonomuraea cypriaca]MBF8184770.1 insulinase family protein [Nonomuraea cypriaca]